MFITDCLVITRQLGRVFFLKRSEVFFFFWRQINVCWANQAYLIKRKRRWTDKIGRTEWVKSRCKAKIFIQFNFFKNSILNTQALLHFQEIVILNIDFISWSLTTSPTLPLGNVIRYVSTTFSSEDFFLSWVTVSWQKFTDFESYFLAVAWYIFLSLLWFFSVLFFVIRILL